MNAAERGAAEAAGRARLAFATGALEDLWYGLNMGARDPAQIGEAIGAAVLTTLRHPDRLLKGAAGLVRDESTVACNALRRYAGRESDPVAAPPAGDRRFQDPAWQEHPLLRAVVES